MESTRRADDAFSIRTPIQQIKKTLMNISELEVVSLLQLAVHETATKLGIADVRWKGVNELLQEIAERDRLACNELKAFLNAYIEWYRFHKGLDEVGKADNLDSQETAELARLVGVRNGTREVILRRLASLS